MHEARPGFPRGCERLGLFLLSPPAEGERQRRPDPTAVMDHAEAVEGDRPPAPTHARHPIGGQ